MATGKQSKERERTAMTPELYRAAEMQGGDTQCPARASAKPRVATGMTRSPEKDAGGGAVVVALFH